MTNFRIQHLFAVLFLISTISVSGDLHAQKSGKGSYFVQFTDKKNTPYSLNTPLEFLSQRSLDRRAKHAAPLTMEDIPVNPAYVDSLRAKGARIMFISRWFNSATIAVDTDLVMIEIAKLPFVKAYQKVYRKKSPNTLTIENSDELLRRTNYGVSSKQITMLNGDFLHQKGFKGQGILIAVLDGGFYRVDKLEAFSYLRDNHRILATHNYITGKDSVYNDATHGMLVLSSMAGQLSGKLVGTAPEASFILLESENTGSEYPIEEDAWVAAAEYADSAGADVINSSLGYTKFDDVTMNHSYEDMNGHTNRSSIGANIAFSKGILVVCSAGNDGANAWHYISSPADGDSVLAIGAVDDQERSASFSSYGPSSDGDVKPNVAAMGVETVVASTTDGEITTVSGTSLSSPILCGVAASLMSAFPDKTNNEIKEVIQKSAHLFPNSDPQMGYGIPDFKMAYEMLSLTKDQKADDFKLLELYPNPYSNDVVFSLYTKNESKINIIMYDNLGRTIYHKEYTSSKNNVDKMNLGVSGDLNPGVYTLIISSGNWTLKKKLVKSKS
jgi:serine protease AprX